MHPRTHAMHYAADLPTDDRPDTVARHDSWTRHVAETVAANIRLIGWYGKRKRSELLTAFDGDEHEIESHLGRALVRAVEKYDPLRKVRLSTYVAGAFAFVLLRKTSKRKERRHWGKAVALKPVMALTLTDKDTERAETLLASEADADALMACLSKEERVCLTHYIRQDKGEPIIMGHRYKPCMVASKAREAVEKMRKY